MFGGKVINSMVTHGFMGGGETGMILYPDNVGL